MRANPGRLTSLILTLPMAMGGLAPTATSAAAGATTRQSPVADLLATLDLLLEVHPGPFRYVTPEELDAALARETVRLEGLDGIDDLQLGRSLHRVLALIGDSHIAVALPSLQPEARTAPYLLPLLPKRVGDRILVDASEPPVPPGTELISLDGRPVGELLDRLADLAIVDAGRPALRRARFERDFTLHFHLAAGTRSEYRARVRLPDGEERVLTLPAVGRETVGVLRGRRLSAPLWGPRPTERPPLPWLIDIERNVRMLRLPTFGVADQEAYRARVARSFTELAGDEALVLDLRGNTGGLRTNGIAVLEHLITGPYAQWSRMETRVRAIPEPYAAHVTFPFTPPTVLRDFPGERRGDRYVYEGDPLAGRMLGTRVPHAGPLAVLVDDATNSTAIEMVAALLAHRPGVRVVGAETIGECGRHVGEIPIMFTTPALGIRVLVSLAEITHVGVPGCDAGRGLVPDIAVRYEEAHFMNGRDPYTEAIGLAIGR